MPKGIKKVAPTPVEATKLTDNQVFSILPEQAPVVNFSTEQLIARAIDQKVDVGTMERLLAMAKEMQAIKAKQEFDKAMANFQAECPTIVKTKGVKTKSGTLAYKYAPIESIVEQVKPFLQSNGFSYSTNMEVLPNGVKVTCKVTHIAGHSEKSEMEVPLGERTQIMSASQVTAAASTFAKRYSFCNAFGILTGDEDNDGASLTTDNKEPVTNSYPPTDKQYEFIKNLMEQKRIDEAWVIEQGFSPLKDLTGGRTGTATELIEMLKNYTPTESVTMQGEGMSEPRVIERLSGPGEMALEDLKNCTSILDYEMIYKYILEGKVNNRFTAYDWTTIVSMAKKTATRLQTK